MTYVPALGKTMDFNDEPNEEQTAKIAELAERYGFTTKQIYDEWKSLRTRRVQVAHTSLFDRLQLLSVALGMAKLNGTTIESECDRIMVRIRDSRRKNEVLEK